MSTSRQFVVYKPSPTYPEHFTVVEWRSAPGVITSDGRVNGFRELDRARAWIQQEFPGAVMLSPHPSDDPKILEVWL